MRASCHSGQERWCANILHPPCPRRCAAQFPARIRAGQCPDKLLQGSSVLTGASRAIEQATVKRFARAERRAVTLPRRPSSAECSPALFKAAIFQTNARLRRASNVIRPVPAMSRSNAARRPTAWEIMPIKGGAPITAPYPAVASIATPAGPLRPATLNSTGTMLATPAPTSAKLAAAVVTFGDTMAPSKPSPVTTLPHRITRAGPSQRTRKSPHRRQATIAAAKAAKPMEERAADAPSSVRR